MRYIKLYYNILRTYGMTTYTEVNKRLELATGKLIESMHKETKDRRQSSRLAKTGGWKLLPNISQFKISLGKYDPILLMHDMYKRLPAKLDMKPAKLESANRYMKYQQRRLEASKGNPKKYWTIALSLIQRSNSFRTSAWNKVYPNWHTYYDWSFVMSTNRKVSQICNSQNVPRMISKRKYIEKLNGKLRPLGIPSPAYRIYLSMLSIFLEEYVRPYIPDQNHAYSPTKGTLTCWHRLIEAKVTEYKYIYETDLKAFFDNVQHWKVRQSLKKAQVPDQIVHLIMELNSKWPDHPSEKNHIKEYKQEIRRRHPINCTPEEAAALAQNGPLALFKTRRNKGVAQGSPISGIIAILCLTEFLAPPEYPEVKSVSYADDPIFYSNKPFKIKDRPTCGIEQNKDKSRWLKWDGKWQVDDFTFLGLNLDVKKDIIRARTRKGSRLQLTEKEITMAQLWDHVTKLDARDRVNQALGILITPTSDRTLSHLPYDWKKTLTGRISGFIMSRLHAGSWNLDHIEQDFEWRAIRNSLASLSLWDQKAEKLYPSVNRVQWNTFTSSSLASHILLDVLRNRRKRITKTYPSHAKMILSLTPKQSGHLEVDNGRPVGPNKEFIEAIKARQRAKAEQEQTSNPEVLLLG